MDPTKERLVARAGCQLWFEQLNRPFDFRSPVAGSEFALLLAIGDEVVGEDERWHLAAQFREQGCRYAVCWGHDCARWDDAIDMVAALREVEGRPQLPFAMTTWHERDTLAEVVEFFAEHTRIVGESWEAEQFVVVVVGGDAAFGAAVRAAVHERFAR